jgi:hypothetical protein
MTGGIGNYPNKGAHRDDKLMIVVVMIIMMMMMMMMMTAVSLKQYNFRHLMMAILGQNI